MSQSSAVRLETRDDGVAVLSLDRPEQLNPTNHESAHALSAASADLEGSDRVRAVVLRGNGPSFCGGGDIGAMGEHLADLPQFLAGLIDSFHAGIVALRRLPVPVLAAVQGAAAGGGFSLAMACDFVVAARSARFLVAYPKLGVSSDGGLSHHLVRRLGAGRALGALLLGDVLTAEQGHALGLVTHVTEDNQFGDTSLALARKLAKLPAQAVREFKSLVSGADLDDLVRQLDREKKAFLRCSVTEDLRNRILTFVENDVAGQTMSEVRESMACERHWHAHRTDGSVDPDICGVNAR